MKIARDLTWSVNSWVFEWALDVLAAEVPLPDAKAALQEARRANITMDVEALPVEARDVIYAAAARSLVPAAEKKFGNAAPFDELAQMAAEALDRYQGKPIADCEIRLTAARSWWTNSSNFNIVSSFLARFLPNRKVAAELAQLDARTDLLLDVAGLASDDWTDALTLLRDRLVGYVHDIGPAGSVGAQQHLGRARELARIAEEVLQSRFASD